ncbi:MAG: hypothetical protein AAB949_00375 [Patescibacteria group bacterium]
MSSLRLIGIIAIFLFSFCSFLFFLFFVNPEYLDFSGFLAFYAGLFGWIGSLFFLLGYYLDKKVQLSATREYRERSSRRMTAAITEGFIRRSGLLTGFIVLNLFFSQIGWWSIYVMIGLVAVVALIEYLIKKKKDKF